MFEVRSHALDMYIFHVKIESLPTCETIVQYKYSALHNTHSPALPVPHPQYNVNTILHMSAEDSEDSEGSEVSSPLQNITITNSSHNSSHRRLYGEPLRAPAGRRGRGGGEEYTLPSHRVPDVVGVTLVNTW